MDPDKIFASKYFINNKYLLRLASLWPYQKPSEKYLLRIFISFSLFTMSVPVLIRAIEELDNEKIDIDLMIENIAGTISFILLTSKFVAPILMEKTLLNLYQEIMKDWDEIKDAEEVGVLSKHATEGRFLTILYARKLNYLHILKKTVRDIRTDLNYDSIAVFLFGNIIPYMTIPAVMPMYLTHIGYKNQTYKKELIHAHAEFFIDQDKYFFYLHLHSIICGCGIVFVSTGADCTFVACVQHVVGLFDIVNLKLKKIAEIASNLPRKEWQHVSNLNKMHRRVVNCIRMHQRAIELTDLIQETYDIIFFIAAVGLVGFFTFITVDLQRNLNNPVRCHRLGTLWTGCIIHLFYINWPGQKMIDASERVYRSTFECHWYELPRNTKFLIQIMMMRSSKSSALTAGPLLEMKFQGLSTVLQASYSYFSVLSAVSE